ncbi:MAG TPA: ABC transporter permease [Catalimonadaceae bacterium]|nr:ABC transporter permease [Catalimonadaceae bacterium]HPI10292.1 ABC transporter permease [Catalimonadaceae bacterium]
MKLFLILDVALGFLMARLRQSVVAAVGVTFGVAMFIALVSFMSGLNNLLDGLILNRTPHIRFYNEIKPSASQPVNRSLFFQDAENFIRSVKPKDQGKEIYNSKAILQALKSDPTVIDVAPKAATQVFFNTGVIEIAGIVNGVDIQAEEKLFRFSDYVLEGDINDIANSSNSIFIGKGIADKLLVDIGDVIQVTSPKGDISSLKVAGIFQFGLAEIDNVTSYASLATVQKLLVKPASYITDIQIKLTDIKNAPATAVALSKEFGVDAVDIQTANSQFETGSKVRTIISYAVGITLLIVAGFGIYNILNMLIYEKMDSIAILKATGFSGRDVQGVFILLSLIIGLAGGLSGLAVGLGLTAIIDNIPFETASLPTIKTYPIVYSGIYYVIGITFAMVTTFFAGLFPARKASKLDPVTIIRGK